MFLTDSRFWIASAERSIKTFAQALVALIGTTAMSVIDLDWAQMLGVSATAAIVSLLTSIASANLGPNYGPSLVDETVEPDPIIVEVEK
jgi:hypothetical protein